MKPTLEGNVAYLAPGMEALKRKRSISGSQLLLKDRLKNFSLNADANTEECKPGKILMEKMSKEQLLIQALNSKDNSILTKALFIKNEADIHKTITKLPVQYILPLLKELTVMLQGKTYPTKIVAILQVLITTHWVYLMSQPEIIEILSSVLHFIDERLLLLTAIQGLRGRVSLITGQMSQAKKQNKDNTEESLLLYQDSDSSDGGADNNDVDLSSESDDNWEEMSDQDVQDEQDEKDIRSIRSKGDNDTDDNDSIYS